MEKLTLFHTGFSIIKDIDLLIGRKNADFGQGFYLSDDEEFSRRWAKDKKGESVFLNTYELVLSGLSVKSFSRDNEWFSYIFNNRHGREDQFPDADVIVGPIANDTIYDVMGVTTSGYLSDDEALVLLRIGPEYRQIVVKTEKAKSRLTWQSSEEIMPGTIAEYQKLLLKEQEDYQELFAKALEEMG